MFRPSWRRPPPLPPGSCSASAASALLAFCSVRAGGNWWRLDCSGLHAHSASKGTNLVVMAHRGRRSSRGRCRPARRRAGCGYFPQPYEAMLAHLGRSRRGFHRRLTRLPRLIPPYRGIMRFARQTSERPEVSHDGKMPPSPLGCSKDGDRCRRQKRTIPSAPPTTKRAPDQRARTFPPMSLPALFPTTPSRPSM